MLKFNVLLACATLSNVCAADGGQLFADLIIDNSLIDGGEKSGFTSHGLLTLGGQTDTFSIFGIESYLHGSYYLYRGKDSSEYIGDSQGQSHIGHDSEYSSLGELYLGLKPSEDLTILFGYIDGSESWTYADYGEGFIHSSPGYTPTVAGLPNYPFSEFGFSIDYRLNDSFSFGFASFEYSEDTFNFDEIFSLLEMSYHYSEGSRITFGVWRNSGLEHFETGERESTTDFYTLLNHKFSDDVSAFVQWGSAERALWEFERFLGLGINFDNVFLEGDQLSAGYFEAEVPFAKSEKVSEIYYQIPVNDKLKLQPDLMYIQNPAGDSSIDSALVFGLRVIVNFDKSF